jgi:AraC family transcriptional regulator
MTMDLLAGRGLDESGVEDLRRSPRVRLLFESAELVMGEFHCGPDDVRWHEENCAEQGNLVVFPGTSVVIQHAGREPVVAGPNQLMLYNWHQTYLRRLLDPRGDHCIFLLIAPALLSEAAGGVDNFCFSATHAPMSAAAYLLNRLIVRRLEDEEPRDHLEVEETLFCLLSYAVASDGAVQGAKEMRVRERTRAQHARLVEGTKAFLAERVTERLTLAEVAGEMLVSPFHLARVFRAGTGFALHEYQNQLRLRLALERVLEPDANLTTVALELGFASHSHFTDSFRRTFTLAPSRIRKMSTITEARSLLPS